eukprot:Awhi_evm1s15547
MLLYCFIEKCTHHTSSPYDASNGFGDKCGECPHGYETISNGGGAMKACLMPENSAPVSIFNRVCYCHGSPILNGISEMCERYNNFALSSGAEYAGVQFSFPICEGILLYICSIYIMT